MAALIKKLGTSKVKTFTDDELQDLRTAFFLIDSNQDGQCDTSELSRMLQKLHIEVKETTIKDLIRAASCSGNELMNEAEFLIWVQKIQQLRPESSSDASNQSDLMAAFRVFDIDQNGYITREELKTAMETIGETVTEEQLTEVLTMADTDRDGKINYEEFSRLLM